MFSTRVTQFSTRLKEVSLSRFKDNHGYTKEFYERAFKESSNTCGFCPTEVEPFGPNGNKASKLALGIGDKGVPICKQCQEYYPRAILDRNRKLIDRAKPFEYEAVDEKPKRNWTEVQWSTNWAKHAKTQKEIYELEKKVDACFDLLCKIASHLRV